MRPTHNQINPEHLATRGHQVRNDDHQQLDTEQHRSTETQPLADVGCVKEEREDCDEPCTDMVFARSSMCTRGRKQACCVVRRAGGAHSRAA